MPSFIASNFTKLCYALVLGAVLLIPAETAAQPTLFVGDGADGMHDIFLRDGEVIKNLTNSPGHDRDFHQSPDGQCIVFTSKRNGTEQIFIMDADGSNQKPLSAPDDDDEWDPVFSRNGSRIAFVREESGDRTSIWTMNKDGSGRKKLTPNGPFEYSDPRWSPDDEDILFDCDELDDDDLKAEQGRNQVTTIPKRNVILWNSDLQFNQLLLQSPVDNYDPEWSPDGSKISLTFQEGQGSGIVVVDLNAQSSQFVTSGSVDGNSSWVGNNTVAFERMAGDTEIYTVSADGTGVANRTNNPADDTDPVGWEEGSAALQPVLFRGEKTQSAPQILFVSDRNGSDDIFVMNADGTGQTALTNMPGNESDPRFFIPPPPPDPPSIAAGGVVMANLLPTVNEISPLSIISVFGSNFSTGTTLFPTLDGNGDLDRILAGTCLEMNGERLPIFAVTPGQINAQASEAQTLGPVSFTVITDCDTPNALRSETARGISPAPQALTSAVEMATVEEATPVFFIYDPVAANGFIAARFNADSVAVAPAGALNDQFGPSRPAVPGDIIVLYGTGWGETTAGLAAGELATDAAQVLPGAFPSVTFGGVVMDTADVFYVGVTPQAAGLYQLAIRVPANAQPGNNQVVLTVYGKSTPVGPVVPVAVP